MVMTEKKDIKSYNLDELKQELANMGEKPFRAGQIYKWLHIEKVQSFDEMTNISKNLRETLDEQFEIVTLEPVRVLISKIDGTRKYLFRIKGGAVIESVLMRYHHGNSVCISTQSGCRMGCRFCAAFCAAAFSAGKASPPRPALSCPARRRSAPWAACNSIFGKTGSGPGREGAPGHPARPPAAPFSAPPPRGYVPPPGCPPAAPLRCCPGPSGRGSGLCCG